MTTPPPGGGAIWKEELELLAVICFGGEGDTVAWRIGEGAVETLKTWWRGIKYVSGLAGVKGRSDRTAVS